MEKKPFTIFAVSLFGLMAIFNIYRLIDQFPVTAGRHSFPLWASGLALVVTLIVPWGLIKEAQERRSRRSRH